MEKINLYEINDQLKPNEKLQLDTGKYANLYLCKCRGEYSEEYFFKQKIAIVLEGFIEISIDEQIIRFSKGDFFKLNENENIKIIKSDALLLTIIEEKRGKL